MSKSWKPNLANHIICTAFRFALLGFGKNFAGSTQTAVEGLKIFKQNEHFDPKCNYSGEISKELVLYSPDPPGA